MNETERRRTPLMAENELDRRGNVPVVEEENEEEDSAYTVEHLSAVVRPVALTMILSSLAVGKIREQSEGDSISSGLSAYLVYNEGSGGGASGGEQFGQALINALVIVGVICAATFILVLCYYFRCIKFMIGYLLFASVNLLGYSGGFMIFTALQLMDAVVDWPTFVFIMFNFAIGGVIAVFWQKGVPRIVTQGYLVCVSVIMSWIVTKLPEWTSWVLLVLLALYDLCAVLTPCGPLRALINLAQTRRDPIPGLLYEANIGRQEGGRGASTVVRDTFVTERGATGSAVNTNPNTVVAVRSPTRVTAAATPSQTLVSGTPRPETVKSPIAIHVGPPGNTPNSRKNAENLGTFRATSRSASTSPRNAEHKSHFVTSVSPTHRAVAPPHTEVGLVSESSIAAAAGVQNHPHSYHHPHHDADHNIAPQANAEEHEERSIKLGLGDFVFYSVLVSRAALYDVATMAACFVSVIMGLAGTLFLLGVMKKALPALPISIFLGVAFYFLTRLVVVPMIIEVSLNGIAL